MNSTLIESPLVKGSNRIALLRSLWLNRVGAQVEELIPVSKAEIETTAKEVVSRTNDDNEIADEEIRGVSPSIVAEKVTLTYEREDEILLAKSEKTRLVREVDAYRWAQGKARGMWLAIV